MIDARVDEPKGDPGNTLSRGEIDAKVKSLALFAGAADAAEMDALLPRLWRLAEVNRVEPLMGA